MSVKQGIILYGCFMMALSACQSNPASSSNNQSQQSSSTQQSSSSTTAQPQSTNSSNTPLNANSRNSNIPAATTTTAAAPVGAETCALLTSAEIEAVRGEPVKDTKGSAGNSSRFAVSQCFYTVATPSKSVSLEVTRRFANQANAASPRDFLREQFQQAVRKRGNRERDPIGKKGVAPQKVAGVGDEAYWVGNAVTGALYVVKGDSFIRISIGGAEDEATKIEKLKTLAQLAVKRLKN